jgi:hypothetical protein
LDTFQFDLELGKFPKSTDVDIGNDEKVKNIRITNTGMALNKKKRQSIYL